jgi:hypothetical protein
MKVYNINLVDIFSINDYNIICKINKEIAIFIGADENDNECIIANVLEVFEECLESITKSSSKKSIMENYQRIALIIDEMVDEGIMINTDSESIENKIYCRENKSAMELNVNSSNVVNSAGGYFKNVNIVNASYYRMLRVYSAKVQIYNFI